MRRSIGASNTDPEVLLLWRSCSAQAANVADEGTGSGTQADTLEFHCISAFDGVLLLITEMLQQHHMFNAICDSR